MATRPQRLHWLKQVQVPDVGVARTAVTARERLVGALAERPLTVAQLAQRFGVAQPTLLEQVRRAVRDGLIVEVDVPDEQRRYSSERYYAPAVPVIRAQDRDLLEPACRAIASELAAVLTRNEADLRAAFELTHLAQEGWQIRDLWPYLQDTVFQLALDRVTSFDAGSGPQPHGLAWVEEIDAIDDTVSGAEEGVA
jgi:hypothetical protein